MMDIEEKYDLMKRDLDKAVKETDNLNEICCRLERENAEFHFENTKLKEQMAIAIEALKCYEQENWTYADEYNYFRLDEYTGSWCHAEKALEQIKELEK